MKAWLKRMLTRVIPNEVLQAGRLFAARQDRELAECHRRFAAEQAGAPPWRKIGELFAIDAHEALAIPAAGTEPHHPWALPLLERCVLASIVRASGARQLFEFGTYLGASTLVLAMNARDDAVVHTLELAPAERERYYRSLGGTAGWDFEAGAAFNGSPYASRIRQHFGDAGTFDFAGFQRAMDVVFVDGDHGYDAVLRDSRAALQMVRPGGAVIWDDYTHGALGVVRCLNELGKQIPLFRIENTRLVIHRAGGVA